MVAGDSGGAPDAVREGETGYVVDGRDVAAVADRMAEPARRPGPGEGMGAAGRAWVEERWSWTTIAATFAELLQPPSGRR